jgi:hypothetical protein
LQTDSKGRFKIKACEGQVRLYANGPSGFAQVAVEAGDTNVVITLANQMAQRQTVTRRTIPRVRPNVSALKGKPLPDVSSLGVPSNSLPAGKPALLCLLDVQQRASKRLARNLGELQGALRQKGLTVLAIQTAPASDEFWNDWNEMNLERVPVNRVSEKTDQNKWATGLPNLPWLILVDNQGTVVDEGFSLEDLDAKLKGLTH